MLGLWGKDCSEVSAWPQWSTWPFTSAGQHTNRTKRQRKKSQNFLDGLLEWLEFLCVHTHARTHARTHKHTRLYIQYIYEQLHLLLISYLFNNLILTYQKLSCVQLGYSHTKYLLNLYIHNNVYKLLNSLMCLNHPDYMCESNALANTFKKFWNGVAVLKLIVA